MAESFNRTCAVGALSVMLVLRLGALLAAEVEAEADQLRAQIVELHRAGKRHEAISHTERLIALEEKTHGPHHLRVASAVDKLADLYEQTGQGTRSVPLLERVVGILERVKGPEHVTVPEKMRELARLHRTLGNYDAGWSVLDRALRIVEKTHGPGHGKTGKFLADIAAVDTEVGHYSHAETNYLRSLEIAEKAFGTNSDNTAAALNGLALLYCYWNRHTNAEPLLQRVLGIVESHSPPHPKLTSYRNNLAMVYAGLGRYAEAEALYLRVLQAEKDHALTHHNLGDLYRVTRDFPKAEQQLLSALELLKRGLVPNHPSIGITLEQLATARKEWTKSVLGSGQHDQAASLAQHTEEVEEEWLANALTWTSEAQRLRLRKRLRGPSLLATVGAAPPLCQVVLRTKAAVLDSVLEDHALALISTNAEQQQLVHERNQTRELLAERFFHARFQDLDDETRRQRMQAAESLREKLDIIERQLARHFAGTGRARRALSVTVDQVQAALPTNAALIEFILYQHYRNSTQAVSRYGAVVLTRAGEPRWLPLLSASQVSERVRRYLHEVRGPSDDTAMARALRQLYDGIWAPIQAALPAGVTTLILSPDGQLNLVSFATLLAPDQQFLAEKFSIHYVSSGRDLLAKPPGASSGRSFVILAGPDFDATVAADIGGAGGAIPARRFATTRAAADWQFSPLPGASREGEQLRDKASEWGLNPVVLRSGVEATEAQLRQLHSPFILHLATHGFVQRPRRDEASDPMFLTGLALAGAQRTVARWRKGEEVPADNDGIVTAAEVGALDLRKTWLVVLSACDTGVGSVQAGEGVLGLRRGFLQAGARNLLLTLWRVDDEQTTGLMLDFYAAAHQLGNAPEALARVQRNWLLKLRVERGVAAACKLAGPFVLTYQGAR
jgi:CHAT domain-containing protein/tetratricopeptide (TPR) repeat protein